MELPILEKLKDGEKFDFATLVNNIDQVQTFWEWWWAQKASLDHISRPETIEQGDPILVETDAKTDIDLYSRADLFGELLSKRINSGQISPSYIKNRGDFRDQLAKVVFSLAANSSDRPEIVFAGGGYGSGKSTLLNNLSLTHTLPVDFSQHIGVDVFKDLIPEYGQIKSVCDGRASFTVQRECVQLAELVYPRLIAARKSFMWDSSMSDLKTSLEKVELARSQGYTITLVALFTPLEEAITQAMRRAKLSRRFPHPPALEASNKHFRVNFRHYVPLFDEIRVFAWGSELNETNSVLIAKKSGLKNQIDCADGLSEGERTLLNEIL